MRMPMHYISFRVFVHATECEESVVSALRYVTDLEEFKRIEAEGHHGNLIIILESEIRRRKEMDALFGRMESTVIQEILGTLEHRVDDNCNLFFRLDKQAAFQGEIRLADHDDVIRARGKIESYPKRRETAMVSIREYLESFS